MAPAKGRCRKHCCTWESSLPSAMSMQLLKPRRGSVELAVIFANARAISVGALHLRRSGTVRDWTRGFSRICVGLIRGRVFGAKRPLRGSRASMAASRVAPGGPKAEAPERPVSPEQSCAICLGPPENQSFTDSCFHTFCFSCLLEWSKVRPPLSPPPDWCARAGLRAGGTLQRVTDEGPPSSGRMLRGPENLIPVGHSTALADRLTPHGKLCPRDSHGVTSARDSFLPRESGGASAAAPRTPSKRNKSGNVLNRSARKLIVHCYECWQARELKCTVEDRVCGQEGGTGGVLSTPPRKCPWNAEKKRHSALYNSFTLNALRSCKHHFFRRNEIPTVAEITKEFSERTARMASLMDVSIHGKQTGDYHEEMDGPRMKSWFDGVLQWLPSGSVMVMDSASLTAERGGANDEIPQAGDHTAVGQQRHPVRRWAGQEAAAGDSCSSATTFPANRTFSIAHVEQLLKDKVAEVTAEHWREALRHVQTLEAEFQQVTCRSDHIDPIVVALEEDDGSTSDDATPSDSDISGVWPVDEL
ncbi:hypothetical protein HPB48_011020 [Haemaphysalis longicornis]|uniref:RING-type E3 ubiquitin transferase n=1 Tax=Haemaphysalis longicornis TaxID=44386 RepID=A0A9J6FXN9_HAELO|nr:hypothetical protein HPB48_011020 [Haemaphysalis longicornis]